MKNKIVLAIYIIFLQLFVFSSLGLSIEGEIFDWHETNNLPVSTYEHHQCTTSNNYIYCIGGKINSQISNEVYFSKINTDGTLGEWNKTIQIQLPLIYNQCFTYLNYIYTCGGMTQTQPNIFTDKVWFSKISSDGSLEEWKETKSLPLRVGGHQCVRFKDFIYTISGVNTENRPSPDIYYPQVWYAQINSNGTIDDWIQTADFPISICYHSCFSASNYIYCSGGYNSNVYYKNVYFSQIQNDGSLTNWLPTEYLPYKVRAHAFVNKNEFGYIVGGNFANDSNTNNVYYTKIGSNASIDHWNLTTQLPKNIAYHQCIISKQFLYSIGGKDSNKVFYAKINIPFPIVNLISHPDENMWYINSRLDIQEGVDNSALYGYWYLIDDVADTQICTDNNIDGVPENNRNFSIINDISHGTHYLHISHSNSDYYPEEKTHHFRFNVFSEPVEITSSTHPIHSAWYSSPTITIDMVNKEYGIAGLYYLIDNKPDTIPNYYSKQCSTNMLFSDNSPGVHYIHSRAYDYAGNLSLEEHTSHYRFNISPITIYSPSHPNQEEWYEKTFLIVQILDWDTEIEGAFHYIVDENSNTVPDLESLQKKSNKFVLSDFLPGTHYLHIRHKNKAGVFSPAYSTTHFRFNINEENVKHNSLPAVKTISINSNNIDIFETLTLESTIEIVSDEFQYTIVQAEYFFDFDPGEGNGKNLTAKDGKFDNSVEIVINENIQVRKQTIGGHILYVRGKDQNNRWGPSKTVPLWVNYNKSLDLNNDRQIDIADVMQGLKVLCGYTDSHSDIKLKNLIFILMKISQI